MIRTNHNGTIHGVTQKSKMVNRSNKSTSKMVSLFSFTFRCDKLKSNYEYERANKLGLTNKKIFIFAQHDGGVRAVSRREKYLL